MQTSQLSTAPPGQQMQPANQPGQPGAPAAPPSAAYAPQQPQQQQQQVPQHHPQQQAPQHHHQQQNPQHKPQTQQQQQQQPQQPIHAQIAQSGGVTYSNAVTQLQQSSTSQSFPHQGLNGGWQSDKDYQERRKMIAKIVHLLQQRKPNAPPEWLKKLPQMAKRLEESLYRSAKSFEEYNDASTLKNRLQQLAVNIGMKTKKLQQQQALLQQQKQQQQRTQGQPLVQSQAARAPAPPGQPMQPPQPQQQQPPQQHLQPQPQQAPASQRMVSMSDINPMISNQARLQQPQPQPQQQQPPAPQQQQAATTTQQQQPPTQYVQHPQQPQQQPAAQGQPQQQGASGGASANGSSTGGRQVSDRQQVLRHQQQRLLLLRHAAKCQHEDGRCPVTPHCAGMKRLWKHIAECKSQRCLVPHCVSSRYVLSHYHRCKDVRCPVCGPVREAIHRSHEKQKQMQALKQRHQQAVQQQQGTAQPIAATAQQQPTAIAPQPSAAVPGQAASATVTVSSATPIAPGPGSVPQPAAPGVVAASHIGALPVQSSGEPVAKRQRTSQGAVMQPPSFQVQQQRPLPQPAPARPGIPGQPVPVNATTYQQANSQQGPARPQVAAVPGIAFSNGQVIMPKHTGPKPQEDHTLINCFSVEQIETHIASLNKGLQLSPQKLKTKCMEVLKILQSHQHGWVFNSPVDPVELGLPDYFEVIKKPMDLGTIRKKLENGVYHSLEEFEGHVHLTFDNAMLYNPEGSVVYNMAKEMKEKFEQDYAKLIEQLNQEEDIKRKNGEACCLCGCEKLLFEPPVFYCNGMNCPSKRIRRNSYYYVGGNNQYHWCHQCFQELKDNQTIDLGDISIKKESLTKKKNDEVHEESWVQCDRCERWVHQICALFNTRQNKDQRSEYACPKCTIVERKKKGQLEGTSTTPMAEDLPRTLLSEYLENHVRKKVNEFIDKKAKEKAATEGTTLEEAMKKVQMGGEITIRQVTSMDRKLEVRERMKKRYAFKNYPDEFTFRCKCIVVFQNLDGVDVVLFGLYVYEHDERNPAPNKRAVYVSYLDSVHYMRPRQMRTFIYHEILISYLDYVRKRGFSTAHIWACPPLKGDDYILYAKPEDQKTPKDDRLRQWYIDMLVESQKRGVVGKVTNMYDLYFKDPKNDATIVPYMDGDYFPAEVENIIKDLEEGKSGKKGSGPGKKKDKKVKKKKKSGRGGTRSTGLDEEALKASGFVPPGTELKTLEEGGRDYVMTKLGDTIQPMKESFIVAFLAWKGADEANMVIPKDIQDYRDKNNITWKLEDSEVIESSNTDAENQGGPALSSSSGVKKENTESSVTAKAAGDSKGTSCPKSGPGIEVKIKDEPKGNEQPRAAEEQQSQQKPNTEATSDKDGTNSSKPPVKEEKAVSSSSSGPAPMEGVTSSETPPQSQNSNPPENGQCTNDNSPTQAPSSSTISPAPTSSAAPVSLVSKDETKISQDAHPIPKSDGQKSDDDNLKKVVPNLEVRKGKFAAMQARKRDRDGTPKEEEEAKEQEKKKEKKREPKTITVKDSKGRVVKVIDDDEEELDCEFLNNRQAFLNLCQGNHYQFDQLRRAKHSSMMVLWHLHNRDAPKFVQQCATCSREILSGYRFHCSTCADFDQCQECVQNPKVPRHPHQLKPMPVGNGQQNELTAAQRKERQRSIQLHMTLLLHAATCNSAKCPSANCTKMKGLLKHGAQCQVKASGGCNVCKRIWALLQLHARQCKAKTCPVPNCMAIRERFRQLKKQQQAMDDRRRQEMNRAYRGKR